MPRPRSWCGPGLLEYAQDDQGAVTVRVIDPSTGAIRWSMPLSGACVTTLDQFDAVQASGLLIACPGTSGAGTLTRVDIDSGLVTARSSYRFATGIGEASLPVNLLPVSGAAILYVDALGPISIQAFRETDLTALWSQDAAAPDGVLEPCEPDLCVISTEDGSQQVIDAITGRPATAPPPTDDTVPMTNVNIAVPLSTVIVVALKPNQFRVGNTATPGFEFDNAQEQGQSIPLPTAVTGDTWVAELTGNGAATLIRPIAESARIPRRLRRLRLISCLLRPPSSRFLLAPAAIAV